MKMIDESEGYSRAFIYNSYIEGIKISSDFNQIKEEIKNKFKLSEYQKNNILIFSDEENKNEITRVDQFFNKEIFYIKIFEAALKILKDNSNNLLFSGKSSIKGGGGSSDFLGSIGKINISNSNNTISNQINENTNADTKSFQKNPLIFKGNPLSFKISKAEIVKAKKQKNGSYKFTLCFVICNNSDKKFDDDIYYDLYDFDNKKIHSEKEKKINMDSTYNSSAKSLDITLQNYNLEKKNTFKLIISNKNNNIISSNVLIAKVFYKDKIISEIKNDEFDCQNSYEIQDDLSK